MNTTEEYQYIEDQNVLQQEFKLWLDLIKTLGNKEHFLGEHLFFSITKSNDEHSIFNLQKISAFIFEKGYTLEGYLNLKDQDLKTAEDEQWIELQIAPEDPYRDKIGFLEHELFTDYFTSQLSLFLSSLGRAFQLTTWTKVMSPRGGDSFLKLKQIPDKEDMIALDDDPISAEDIISPFEPISGQVLERLHFLRLQFENQSK